ncbi:anti-sigma factor [Actinoplanes sp. NPDC023714]|uniref:anti-sigma factor n=1 Tax=Actinoplanes sp. NPDC023714 TaxID=3154322 RepID=UPI0034085D8A
MQHLDPDRLVLLALSEESEDLDEADHLTRCAGCRHDFAALREVADIGAQCQELRDLPAPPESVWEAIAADVRRTPAVEVTATPVTDLAERRGRAHRRPARRWTPLIAAAAAAVLAVGGTLAVGQLIDRRTTPAVTARATLEPLPTVPVDAGGRVRVLDDGDLEIDVRNLPLTTGFHEVWLIDPDDTTKMVAIGNLTGDKQVVLPVPPGTDLNRYRLVDVSDEPHDGDATHSGVSLLRGTLTS